MPDDNLPTLERRTDAPRTIEECRSTPEAIRFIRRRLKMNMSSFARRLGVELTVVSNLEIGHYDLTPEERQERRERMKATHAALHPYGHCTCGGEGLCAWCLLPCGACHLPRNSTQQGGPCTCEEGPSPPKES